MNYDHASWKSGVKGERGKGKYDETICMGVWGVLDYLRFFQIKYISCSSLQHFWWSFIIAARCFYLMLFSLGHSWAFDEKERYHFLSFQLLSCLAEAVESTLLMSNYKRFLDFT
jgi:hypothetical protein